jgi:hypothetical protein
MIAIIAIMKFLFDSYNEIFIRRIFLHFFVVEVESESDEYFKEYHERDTAYEEPQLYYGYIAPKSYNSQKEKPNPYYWENKSTKKPYI